MTVILLTEKPDASMRIAKALAESGTLKTHTNENKVSYYEFKRGGKNHIVICAVGHLFNLDPKDKGKGWTYPIFDAEWKPSFKVRKDSEFSKKYFDVVQKMIKGGDEYVVATDYDTEGCLTFDEKILVKENGVARLEKVGEFVERCLQKHPTKNWNEFEYAELNDTSVPVMNDKFGLKFGKIRKVMKRVADKKILQITTELGRKVRVSKNHPFFVLSPFGLNLKKAGELEVGEYVPIVKELPFSETKIKEIDLIYECSKINGSFYVYGARDVIKLMPSEISKIVGVKRKTCLGWRFFDRLPLWAYLKLEPKNADRKKLKIGVKKSKVKIPAVIRLDSGLGRLAGYYLSEGCVDSSGFVGFYFGSHEKHLVDETENLFKNIFGIKKMKRRFRKTEGSFGKGFSYEIGTKGRMISIIFQKILNLGSNAYEKRLPKEIFSMPLEFVTNLIDAYLLGDGSIFVDSRDERIIISAASVSNDLIDGLQLLLLSMGINSSLVEAKRENRKNVYYLYFSLSEIKKLLNFKISGLLERNNLTDKLGKFSEITLKNPMCLLPYFLLEGCKLTKWADHNINYSERVNTLSIVEKTPLVRSIIESGTHFLKIRKIEEVDYDGFLYDLETDTHSFSHGNGIITHNSVIGFNVLKFLGGVKDGKRMRFSTLTKDELVDSYANMSAHLDFPQIEAGLTRHELDWLWGLNLTRAMTIAMKNASGKGFAILSTGRVQGPTLAILLEKELDIRKFKSKPYWQILAHVKIGNVEALAEYEKDKIWDKKDADTVLKSSQVKDAEVKNVKKREIRQSPPVPFNTTDLLSEAYSQFKFSPTQTMRLAESLYQSGILSYPRTASQKLPTSINYVKILKALSQIPQYKKLCEELLKKEKLVPNEGKRDDPAHPAVYPTHEVEDLKKLTAQQKKIYDLVVRRFLAVFAEPALRESMNVQLDIGGNKFVVVGKRTIESGWIKFYEPYTKSEEIILPDVEVGDRIKVLKAEQLAKETQPPGRYSQGSILKIMEEKNIGTKATRAEILQTLYDRKYINDKSIRVTKLGEVVTKTLKEYCPRVLSEELTRHFESEMELVSNGKKKRSAIVEEAKEFLEDVLKDFKKNEKDIGKKLLEGLIAAREIERTLGTCPNCKTGQLKILRSRFSGKFFVGCSSYFRCVKCGFTRTACKCKCPICGGVKGKCKCEWKEKKWLPSCQTGFPLPGHALIQGTGKVCEKCSTPIVTVIRKGKRPFRMCLATDCETKKDWGKPKKLPKHATKKEIAEKEKELKEAKKK